MRALGLSRQKIGYARALADAGIDFDALPHKPLDDVIAELTAVSGIGVWTAEIYAMFSLHRADVFAHADLALQEAARHLFNLINAQPQSDARYGRSVASMEIGCSASVMGLLQAHQ